MEVVRRLEHEETVQRLRLDGAAGTPIDVADIASFVLAAPALLNRRYRFVQFRCRLNDGWRAYQVSHLDQSLPGLAFTAPLECEEVPATMLAVLAEYADKGTDVVISTGPWH